MKKYKYMLDTNIELWKPAKGYKDEKGFDISNVYEVSNYGRVRTIMTGHIKLANVDRNGYCKFRWRDRIVYVHRLVGITWLENEEGYPVLNHINGIKTDNRVSNLEWCTYKHNCQEAYRLGLNKGPKKYKDIPFDKDFWKHMEVSLTNVFELPTTHIHAKCREIYQLDLDENILAKYSSIAEASQRTGIHRNCINDFLCGRLKKGRPIKTAGGYKWKYA